MKGSVRVNVFVEKIYFDVSFRYSEKIEKQFMNNLHDISVITVNGNKLLIEVCVAFSCYQCSSIILVLVFNNPMMEK